jgi:hypothetical protein
MHKQILHKFMLNVMLIEAARWRGRSADGATSMLDFERYTVEQVAAEILHVIERKSDHFIAGSILALSRFRILPEGVTPDEWRGRLDALDAFVLRSEGPDEQGALGWLDRELMPIMRRIPAKERIAFVRGVIDIVLTFHGPRTASELGRRRRTHGGRKERRAT